MANLIKKFTELSKSDSDIAGGKGASLGEMTQTNIPVPPGFVILTPAFERFLEETDLNVEVDSILHSVNRKAIHTIDKASEEIKALILGAEMPQDITLEIQKSFNGHGSKKYGRHKYVNHDATSSCEYGCGCWRGSTRSGGPAGLDPFGTCPGNPKDGRRLGGTGDYEYVVTDRIKKLSLRLQRAESRLKRVSPSKVELANELITVKAELARKNLILAKIIFIVQKSSEVNLSE